MSRHEYTKLRLGPRDRDVVDWMAHAFGRTADYLRGHRKSVTAIEREEASNRLIEERARRRSLKSGGGHYG